MKDEERRILRLLLAAYEDGEEKYHTSPSFHYAVKVAAWIVAAGYREDTGLIDDFAFARNLSEYKITNKAPCGHIGCPTHVCLYS